MERLASKIIELSTQRKFAHWLAGGIALRGWARSVSGDTAVGISWIKEGIKDLWEVGTTPVIPFLLALKAEALHLADRTSEVLQAIKQADVCRQKSAAGAEVNLVLLGVRPTFPQNTSARFLSLEGAGVLARPLGT